MMKHLFHTVGEAAEKVGNTIGHNDHTGGFAAGFLAMLKKIEFGVDRFGRAERPSLYVPPSSGQTMVASLESQPIEYHLTVETLSVEKEKKAVAREAERIS